MHRPARLPVALVAAAALLAACGGDDPAPAAETATAEVSAEAGATPVTNPAAAAPTVPVIGSATAPVAPTVGAAASTAAPAIEAPEALRFTAPLVGGGEIDAAAYAGQPVLFWFWAPY